MKLDFMHGYIEIPEKQRRFAYNLDNNVMTVFTKDSLPLDPQKQAKFDLVSDTPWVIGNDIISGDNILFFVDNIPFADSELFWASAGVRVRWIIKLNGNTNELSFNNMEFSFPELNCFFPISKGINRARDYKFKTFKIETLPSEQTKECFSFNFNFKGQNIGCELGFDITLTSKFSPLKLNSTLNCSFENSLDANLIVDIYFVIKRLFYILCRRQSVSFGIVYLKGVNQAGKQRPMGELFILDDCNSEDQSIIDKTVKFDLLKSNISNLIQLCADRKLYLENTPETDASSRRTTVASFILDSAAFEWTFEQCYGKLDVSQARKQVKEDILNTIASIPGTNKYNSKKKSEIKLYQKIVSNVDRSLSEKILYALKDMDQVLSPFIRQIYSFSKQDFNPRGYSKIAEDLQSYRNAYAHGNIKVTIGDDFILQTIILEWLNHCMIFKMAGYSKDEIFELINVIFERHCIRK